MDQELRTLNGQTFDVVVIGGGINGTSAAQLLAADGYSVLLVEKRDFGSGASGRSARMLHPGLRYFEAKKPVRYFGSNPGRFFAALRGARLLMNSVSELLKDDGDLVWPYRMCFPVFAEDDFKAWHVAAGIRLLEFLGDGTVPFDFEMVRKKNSEKLPFYSDFRDPDSLSAVACYNEFKFDWPERYCASMALDAERNGAVVRNYCSAKIVEQVNEGWRIELSDDGGSAEVVGRRVLNIAGTWTEAVLPNAAKEPLVTTTKGVHLVVELPDRYRGHGIASMNSLGEPYYITPLHKNFFSIGVTETPFSGDASDVRAGKEDIDFLLAETNRLLPKLNLTKKDVLRTWAGVRPLTSGGARDRVLHDLSSQGYPGVYGLTSGAIITHRDNGRILRDKVKETLEPFGEKGTVDYTPFTFSRSDNSPVFLEDEPDVRESDLEYAATHEHGRTLADVLDRRTGLAWRRTLTTDEISRAAGIIGNALNWDNERTAEEARAFSAYQQQQFGVTEDCEALAE
jgi:glycerol-3-phosphate dehydrogenase